MKAFVVFFVALVALPAMAASLLPLTQTHPSFAPSASAGGDSTQPIISSDGRFVLFASTANNLALCTNVPFQPSLAPVYNVYLHDRLSNTTALVSLNLSGTGGADHDAWPAGISTNGQFVLFESAADNLVAGDTNSATDVFVRDVVNGTTTLVSVSTNGFAGNGASYSSTMTPDGRYVAFASAATNLVVSDGNGIPDIFVRDLQGGITRLVSVGAMSTGSTILPSASDTPAITPDGRYVAFFSTATNLVAGGKLAGDVYVRDLMAGATTWASVSARSLFKSVLGTTNAISCNLKISDDGNYVAFETCTNPSTPILSYYSYGGIVLRYNVSNGLTDLVNSNTYVPIALFQYIHNLSLTPDGRFIALVGNSPGAGGANTAIYLWDSQAGTNQLVSVNTNGTFSTSTYCDAPVISTNGQFVAFLSSAPDLVTNTLAGTNHLYLRNIATGTTLLLDTDTNGAGSGVDLQAEPVISANGQAVAFESVQANLVGNDYNHDYDVFVRDLGLGTMELESARQPALPSTAPNGFSTFSAQPISQNGRYLAFASDADDLVPGDTNQYPDVFVRDLFTGSNTLVSIGLNGAGANGISFNPAMSSGGRYVAFASAATNLIAGDINNSVDVFVRDLQGQSTSLVSVNSTGAGEGNGDSYSPMISSDGRYVMFLSKASNLTTDSFTRGTENLFVRDRQLGTSYALTTAGWFCASMTPDGRFVAFTDVAGSTAGKVYVWNAQTPFKLTTNSITSPILTMGINSNGTQVAYFAGSMPSVYLLNRSSNTVTTIAPNSYAGNHAGLRFSSNSRFLAYASYPMYGVNQVYLYDVAAKTQTLISHAAGVSTVGNGSSDSPDISPDGRYVAYRSSSSNLVSGDTNGVPDIFLFDSTTGSNTVLTASIFGAATANNCSLAPVFSADGHTLVLRSWASDLSASDFNQTSALYGYAFLYPAITSANSMGTTISWTALPNETYTVQYKNNLTDATWQTLSGTMTVVGDQGSMTDSNPASDHRYYRVIGN